ncbi:hypothetical protein SUGI_0911530 [Cryptomeria japonica]|nr:hypothetical protein SUGI_0911530 [Cryptomeria japonica]
MEAMVVLFLIEILALLACRHAKDYVSVLGDSGMKNKRVRVALEGWNQYCNEVGAETPGMGIPKYADCSNCECPFILYTLLQEVRKILSSVVNYFQFHGFGRVNVWKIDFNGWKPHSMILVLKYSE